MATEPVSLIDNGNPDNSGNVFFEPYSVKATNDQWDPLVLVFNNSGSRDSLYGIFRVPQTYASGATFEILWTATATTGSVVWDFDYRAVGGDDAESLDQTGTQEAVTVTDAAPSAAHERMVATAALTDGNFSSGDIVEFLIARDSGNASDDLSAAAIVFGAYFTYSA